MRTRTLLLLVSTATVLVFAVGAVLLYHHLHWSRTVSRPAAALQLVRLPFALPCSPDTRDASLFYSALRRGDRAAVTGMFAANKVYMIPKGTALSIESRHPVAIVTTEDDSQVLASCFIPADVVPAIERKAYK